LKVYIPHFLNGHSLVKCAVITGVSKQTSFDWCYKILAALGKQQNDIVLSGIYETDEVFITYSEKGNQNLEREPRKRCKSVFVKKKQGISDAKVAILVSCYRKGNKHLQIATRGRVITEEISNVLEDKIAPKTVLRTDRYRSYERFGKDNNLER